MLSEKLKQKIKAFVLSEEKKELLIKEIDKLSDIIIKNVQTSRKEN